MRFLIYTFFIVAAACGVTFWYVDGQVKRVLADVRDESSLSAVYSDEAVIQARPYSPKALRSMLVSRRYREVQKPATPGDFHLSDDELLLIPRGQELGDERPELVRLGLVTGALRSSSNARLDQVKLEPVSISNLGFGETRASSYVPLSKMPATVKNAVIAIEDERFYDHHGIDFFGILRAITVNLRAGALRQGGSTLTQQYAKNVILSPQRTLRRKFMELFAALSLEYRLSKDELLERYLNEVYLGQEGAIALHGVPEAAQAFFGKEVGDLTVGEAALIAGVIRAPSYLSPRRHPTRAQERRDVVLRKMAEVGKITEQQARRAASERPVIVRERRHRELAPHYIAAVQRSLESELDTEVIQSPGISIYSGITLEYQRCAEEAVQESLTQLEKTVPRLRQAKAPIEVGLVSIEPFSGKIRAWVGGRDFSRNQFNHVDQSKRQLGSAFKPFLYLTALDSGLNSYRPATAASLLPDRPMQVQLQTKDTWEPENYDHSFRGEVTLRTAVENSLNMPAVYLSERVGLDAVRQTAIDFQLADNIQAVPSLALGAVDVSLLRVTSAFGALANGGIYVPPRLFLSVRASDGTVLTRTTPWESRIADERAVYVLTDILKGVITRGTAASVRAMGFTGDAAGKTGTSNETRDAWFVGFTPDLVTGVWVGFDNNDQTGLTGGRASAPIWARYMMCIAPYREQLQFVEPPGIVTESIDSASGLLASPDCPAETTSKEVFVRGTEPRRYCSLHGYTDSEEVPAPLDDPADRRRPPTPRRKSLWERLVG